MDESVVQDAGVPPDATVAAAEPVSAEPKVVGEHMVIPGDHPIDIGNKQTAPLADLIASRNPHCRYCTEGWVRRRQPDGTLLHSVCACCVERYRKKLAADARERKRATTIGIAATPSAAEEARAQRRIDRLTRELAELENEMVVKGRRFLDSSADLETAITRHCVEVQDSGCRVLVAKARAAEREAEIRAVEDRLSLLRQSLAGLREEAEVAAKEQELAQAMKADCDREINRRKAAFEESTRGLRREIDRVRRRLARARIYSGLERDAEPTEAAG